MAHTATQMRYGDKHMNDNKPRMAVRGEWYGDIFEPDTPHHKLPQEAILAKQAEDKAKERKQRVRLGKRAAKGKDWDGTADNDNINWPLAKALLAEGNDDLLRYAIMYRRTYEMASSDVMLGIKGNPSPDIAVARKSKLDESTGRIIYGGEIISKGHVDDIPAMRAVPTNPDSKKRAAPVPRPWEGDRPVNDAIDARGKLDWMRALLGPTKEPFEMACIDGATLAEVGAASGASSRDGKPGAGRAVCHLALITIRDALGRISYRDIAA